MRLSSLTQVSHSRKSLRKHPIGKVIFWWALICHDRYVAEALYGNVPGASLTNISGIGEVWALPCDQELNATFLFAGIHFPIHPLDLNFDIGNNQCIGAVSLWSFDFF
jgi:hypothetical protein